jgi:hypothetical protein
MSEVVVAVMGVAIRICKFQSGFGYGWRGEIPNRFDIFNFSIWKGQISIGIYRTQLREGKAGRKKRRERG